MKISICAATKAELSLIQEHRSLEGATDSRHEFQYCLTGVGMLQSCFYIQQHVCRHHPELLLQIGIAGCFDEKIPLGAVMAVEREYLGSLGVVENGQRLRANRDPVEQWRDIFDLGLQDASKAPFDQKALINPYIQDWTWLTDIGVRPAQSLTVDEITSSPVRMRTLMEHYRLAGSDQAVLESMEGASLHFNALQYKIPFLQLRGISNYVGQRDKSKWQIQLALKEVTQAALQVIDRL